MDDTSNIQASYKAMLVTFGDGRKTYLVGRQLDWKSDYEWVKAPIEWVSNPPAREWEDKQEAKDYAKRLNQATLSRFITTVEVVD